MAKPKKQNLKTSRPPPQPTDCRDAMHWFQDNYGNHVSSVRGLFATDVTADQEAYIESTIVNLRNKGIEPFVVTAEEIYNQSQAIWQQAVGNSPFGQPYWTMSEIDLLSAPVAIIKDLVAPEQPHQLWYLYHYILYPRLINDKSTIVTTPLGLDEFFTYGAQCDDIEYAGFKITWDKVMWLFDACMIDLHHFRKVKSEGLPPMLKAEYYLFNAFKERGLSCVAQQILGDYQLDLAVTEGDNRLAIEVDKLSSLDTTGQSNEQTKKNFVLLSDGWKILRFTANEVLEDLSYCADACEQVWNQGRKKASIGRFLFGRKQPSLPALPQDDEVQKLAITNGAGAVVLTGCAGTGKTYCIAHRIEYLLAQGVSPERILAFTYSEETKIDLERTCEILTDKQTVQKLNISDWRDVGFRILKENASEIKRKPPLKLEQNPQRVFERVLKRVKKEYDPVQLELISQELSEEALRPLIGIYKANLVTPKHVQEHGQNDFDQFTAKIYKAYTDQLKKSNKVDSDDCITLCALFLADNEEARVKYSCKYDYVLIDEFQECTPAQNLMARLLSYPQDNLFVVGDEDEALYESKGGQPRVIAESSIRMPNARCYTLEKNWRSHKAIVKSSMALLTAMSVRIIPKKMEFAIESKTRNAIIGPNESKNEKEEVEWVAKEVSLLIESGKMPHEIAILYNDHKYANILETALFRENIRSSAAITAEAVPDEVGDVMAFLTLVMDPDGPKARKCFERICQLRSRELDQKLSRLSSTIASFGEANALSFLKAIEIYYEATNDSHCKDLNDLVRIVRTMNQEALPPAETINLLKRTQKLRDIYKSAKIPNGVVYEPMQKVEQLQEEAREYKTVKEFLKAKEDLANPQEEDEEKGFVQIKSVEEAKGKEFPIVFVVGLADGVFPAQGRDLEEERRRFYVAISRAKDLLYLSTPIFYEEVLRVPSPFLVEADILSVKAFQKRVQAREQEQIPIAAVDATKLTEPQEEEAPLSPQEEAVLAKEKERAKAQEEAIKQVQDEKAIRQGELTAEDQAKQLIVEQAKEAKAKAERVAHEIAAKDKAEAEKQRLAEEGVAEREELERVRAEEEAKAKEEAELEKIRKEQEKRAQAEAEAAKLLEEQEATKKASEEAEQQAAEAEKLRKEQEAQAEAERQQKEQQAAEAEKLRKEQEAQAEAERLQKEQQAAEAEKLRKEQEAQAEAERLQKEQQAAEAEKLRKEQQAQAEAERLQKEQQAAEAEKLRKEREAQAEAEQLQKEQLPAAQKKAQEEEKLQQQAQVEAEIAQILAQEEARQKDQKQVNAMQESQAKIEAEAQAIAQQEAEKIAQQEKEEEIRKKEEQAQILSRQQAAKERAKAQLFPDDQKQAAQPVQNESEVTAKPAQENPELDSIFGDISGAKAVEKTGPVQKNAGSVDVPEQSEVPAKTEEKPVQSEASSEVKDVKEDKNTKRKKKAEDKLKERAKKKQEEAKAFAAEKDKEIAKQTAEDGVQSNSEAPVVAPPPVEGSPQPESFAAPPPVQEELPQPVVQEPAVQEQPPQPAVQEPAVQEQPPQPAAQEPAVQEQPPQPAVQEPAVQEKPPQPAVQETAVQEQPPQPKKNPFVVSPGAKNPFKSTTSAGSGAFAISVSSATQGQGLKPSQPAPSVTNQQKEAPKTTEPKQPPSEPTEQEPATQPEPEQPVKTSPAANILDDQVEALLAEAEAMQKDAEKSLPNEPETSAPAEQVSPPVEEVASAPPPQQAAQAGVQFNQYGVPAEPGQQVEPSPQAVAEPEQPVQQDAPPHKAEIPTVEGSTIPICPHCMIHLEVGSRFCGECGYQLESRIPACPGCQLPVVPGAKFCGECGFALQHAQ